MASNQVTLALFCGEIWRSLSTATPLQVSMRQRNASSSTRRPGEDNAPVYPWQEAGLVLPSAGGAPAATAAAPFPEATPEPSDSSWVAALLIGIILTGMLTAIFVIVLWKCCKRPAPVDSNWAGRSPFADGDTPDAFTDPDQATKRSSVLFMLPWKLKQDTNLQQDPTAPEKPPGRGSRKESGAGCPGASTNPAPCPEQPPVPPDLPPPPDWLRDPAEDHGPEPSGGGERHWGPEEPLPPPPQPARQGTQEPPPQLPQPQQPLEMAELHTSPFSQMSCSPNN